MAYVYLSFFLVTNLLFVNLLRFAQKRRIEIFTTLAINYWIAAAVSIAVFLWEANRNIPLVPSLIGLGITNGLIYFIHLVIMLKAYRIAGTGITVALAQSASVVPIITSWLLWRNEVMTPGRWIAAGLCTRPPMSRPVLPAQRPTRCTFFPSPLLVPPPTC